MTDTPSAPPPELPSDPAHTPPSPPLPPSHSAGFEPTSRRADTAPAFDAGQLKATFQRINQLDLVIMAAGLLAFIFSFLPYYTVSFAGVSASATAWHGFFGWFGALVALAAAVVLVLPVFGMRVLDASLTRLAVLIGFAVATLCTLIALFVIPGKSSCGGLCRGLNFGHGVGYWLALIVSIVGLVVAYLRKDAREDG